MFPAQCVLSLILQVKNLSPRDIVTCFHLVVGLELEPQAAEPLPSILSAALTLKNSS